jgi:hypothetical protein
MSVRLPGVLILAVSVLALALVSPSLAVADPASDLIAAEEAETAAQAKVATAEDRVKGAEANLEPIATKAAAAAQAAEKAEDEEEAIRERLVAERTQAAEEIKTREADYQDAKSTHDTVTAIGVGVALFSLLMALGAFVYSKFRKWPLSKQLTQMIASGLGVAFVGGLGMAFIPSPPDPPEFSVETQSLASAAKGDPTDPPTKELIEAEAATKPLAERAAAIDKVRDKAESSLADAESEMEKAEAKANGTKKQVKLAANVVEREEREAAKEAAFREEATTIDYDQLIKNPYRYIGEKVVYTGQIFQIQEGGGSFMLLSVTDEGYGFWTDEIWVAGFGSIESAEEDVITVYGTVTGAEEYETAIGGSNYVPRIKAKYVDE